VAAAVAALLCGCTDDLDASCDGETVNECAPYTYAVVRSATIEPEAIMPGDPTPEAGAHVRVAYASCGEKAPGTHRIVLSARTTGAGLPDAGESLRVVVLDEWYDDGTTHGDEVARDGVLDIMVANPFFDLQPNTTVRLRFEPHLMSCIGDGVEADYTTGPMWSADGGL
jgi:hypothetical protein